MVSEVVDPYGFIYITTNMINGKRYVGQKKFNKGWQSYIGSGSALKHAIKKYGKENFVRNIVDIAYSKEELDDKEVELIAFLNAQFSTDYYNIDMGGVPTSRMTLRGENNPNYGKKLSAEARKRISEAQKGRVSPNKGKKASEETRQKQRDAWVKRKERGDIGTKKAILVHPIEKMFNSVTEACEELKLNYYSVMNVIHHHRNSVYGYTFEYI